MNKAVIILVAVIAVSLSACKKETNGPVAGVFKQGTMYLVERETFELKSDSVIVYPGHSYPNYPFFFRFDTDSAEIRNSNWDMVANAKTTYSSSNSGVAFTKYETPWAQAGFDYSGVKLNLSTTDSFYILSSPDNKYKVYLLKD